MQKIVILLSLVSAAYAGVGVLTAEVEAEALRLWQAHCEGASEGGTDGSTSIYCKKSTEKIEEALTHEHALPEAGDAGQQVVFIQPPSYHYKHDVVVSGGGGSAPKTVIYVKPAKNTNEVNIVDQTSGQAPAPKPQLFFLRGDHGGAAGAAPRSAEAAPAEEAEAPSEAAPVEEGAARKRRQNGPDALAEFPATEVQFAVPQPKKRTVYILRRAFA